MDERRRLAVCFGRLLPLFLLALYSASSQAALSTNITGIVDDITTFFGSVQTLVISVVVFGIAIGYAKMMRKK